MSAGATTAPSGLSPFYRRRGFWQNAVPMIAMVATFLIGVGLYSGLSGSSEKRIPLPMTPHVPKTVSLDGKELRDMHALIRQFVHTAVAHRNLARSYQLIGPALREDISRTRWADGQTTVVPYPVDAKTSIVFEQPDHSYARSVQIQVHVITPDRPNQTALAGPETFFVDLIKVGGRWLVNSWVPRWSTPLRNATG